MSGEAKKDSSREVQIGVPIPTKPLLIRCTKLPWVSPTAWTVEQRELLITKKQKMNGEARVPRLLGSTRSEIIISIFKAVLKEEK